MATHTITTRGSTPAVIDLTRPDRRQLLGDAIAGLAGAAILAGGGVTIAASESPTSNLDARLIQIGREAAELRQQRVPLAHRWFEQCRLKRDTGACDDVEVDRVGDAIEPIDDRLDELFGEAIDLQATTFEGAAARAQVALGWFSIELETDAGLKESSMGRAEQLAFRICRDLAQMTGAPT